jgi:hypothetical protein
MKGLLAQFFDLICLIHSSKFFSFLQHRFNPPVPSGDGGSNSSQSSIIHNSTVESTQSDSFEAMLEIQT